MGTSFQINREVSSSKEVSGGPMVTLGILAVAAGVSAVVSISVVDNWRSKGDLIG